MNYKEIFIHVGMPKTGTTFVQNSILPFFDDVYYLDKSNEKYATIFQDFFFRNLTIYNIANLKKDIELLFDEINEKKILISDEAWFGSTLGGSHYNFSNNYYLTILLKEIFPKARIILTIRRQDKWLESMYKHLLRDGYYLGINSFLNYSNGTFGNYRSYFREGPNIDIRILDYSSYINNYETVFGKGNIIVLTQEMLKDNRAKFLQCFSEYIGSSLTGDKLGKTGKANTGYLYIGGVAARVLNRLFIFKGKDGGIFPISEYKYLDFRKYLRFIDKAIPLRKSFVSPQMKKLILDYHSKGNSIIDEKYKLDLKKYKYYE